ncbi:dual specificity protein phosphatase family protein [Desulfobulbus sp.]|uniref:protein-tyrosine phosphatase family protein n=1 Tax=Desulfobulbus sp. TaxID=895 RepID=UPI00286F8F8C|nr:dual specificity protein phosphatase family protein [Desulfobulbus sp.]
MYRLHWITDHLATGHAPMSYEDLESIRAQGIRAIVNLCGEFCDLHQIEESSGFEVFYLPVADECAPDLAAMEQALDWLDESIYLDKKVLVHCRMGQGRTGTFVAAYLLRRGFDFKGAEQTLKGRLASPSTFAQRRFLKRYGKQSGPLKSGPPRIDNRPRPDVEPLLEAYAQAIAWADAQIGPPHDTGCGIDDHPCCHSPFDLDLIESMALSQAVNRGLTRRQRQAAIERAVALAQTMKDLHRQYPGLATEELAAHFSHVPLPCPLLADGRCQVFADRPPRCRYGQATDAGVAVAVAGLMAELSRQAYQILTGRMPLATELRFSSADTVSGKFVQLYFQAACGKTG